MSSARGGRRGTTSRDPLAAFLWEFWRDVEGGGPRDAGHYLARYPQLEGPIEEELEAHHAMARVTTEQDRDWLDLWLQGADTGDGSEVPVASSPMPALHPGQRVGDFLLVSLLGRGGMGQVWVAEQLSLGARPLALKFLHDRDLGQRAREWFAREARAGGRLAHPNIVAIHGCGEAEGRPWIAMELVERATSLRELIDEVASRPTVPERYDRDIASFVATVAEAMEHSHGHGVIHRDLKPRNILIGPDRRPKISDFGLARIDGELGLTGSGPPAGTCYYMSPEQVSGERAALDERTDVFSLGAVLYEALTLRRPFEGDTTHQVAEQVLTSDPVDPRRLRSQIPTDLACICAKALEKRPEDRYPSMAAMAADLRRHLNHEPILAAPPGWLRRLRKWCLRHPTRSVAASLTLIAFLAVVTLGVIAQRNAVRARENARIAEQNALAEMRRADQVLRLSALQDLEDRLHEADLLWPAHPSNITAFEAWIAAARALTDDLPGHRELRRELRARALERTAEQRRTEREAHPAHGELLQVSGRLAQLERALGQRRGESRWTVEEPRSTETSLSSARLHAMARERVAPNRQVFGEESLGLACVQRALERAQPLERPELNMTLAWAYFALGRDDEALEAMFHAFDGAPEEERPRYEQLLGELEALVEWETSAEGLRAREAELDELRRRHDELEATVDRRREWHFSAADPEARWWNNQLTKLIDGLERLETGLVGATPAPGLDLQAWSVPQRLARALELQRDFADGGPYARAWARALPSLEAEYPELTMEIQMGLVPLGADPVTGLHEFADVLSGTPPSRDEEGRLELTDESGLVFVLLHGGRFSMGSQATHPADNNYDPLANSDSGPVHTVELGPFLISKYEMTQGQWLRIRGTNPSTFDPTRNLVGHKHDLTHPVEMVDWDDAHRTCTQLGLILPSEARWEFAARAGTDTPWWTGADPAQAHGKFNLFDRQAAQVAEGVWNDLPEVDDGYAAHAPVDHYPPNGFGLHNVLGNVREWCLDAYEPDFYQRSMGPDPVADPRRSNQRVARGGSFYSMLEGLRVGYRMGAVTEDGDSTYGLRPAREWTAASLSAPAGR